MLYPFCKTQNTIGVPFKKNPGISRIPGVICLNVNKRLSDRSWEWPRRRPVWRQGGCSRPETVPHGCWEPPRRPTEPSKKTQRQKDLERRNQWNNNNSTKVGCTCPHVSWRILVLFTAPGCAPSITQMTPFRNVKYASLRQKRYFFTRLGAFFGSSILPSSWNFHWLSGYNYGEHIEMMQQRGNVELTV